MLLNLVIVSVIGPRSPTYKVFLSLCEPHWSKSLVVFFHYSQPWKLRFYKKQSDICWEKSIVHRKKKYMSICIYIVHLFLYECITCKVKSCLSNYCTFHVSYITTKYTKMQNNSILVGHPVTLVSQAKDFRQHHMWCFPLPCTREKISLNAAPIPCNDQPWCPHMQHSWHSTEVFDLVVYDHILSTSILKKW